MKQHPSIFHSGVAVPFIQDNIDTDIIIPSREMKKVSQDGLSDGLFAGRRYKHVGSREINPDFILNKAGYQGGSILFSGHNFGCGSSREHAVWALKEYGFKVIIAESFGAIFYDNCLRNGLLPLTLPKDSIAHLNALTSADPQKNILSIDLTHQKVMDSEGAFYDFDIHGRDRIALLEGLDAIDVTLKDQSHISAFQKKDRTRRPWIYL